MEVRNLVPVAMAVALATFHFAPDEAMAQTASDDTFDPHRAYLQQPHVRDMSAAQKQRLNAKLEAATVKNSASVMVVFQRNGFKEVRASINPRDDMLMLELVGNATNGADSLPMEVEYALDAVAQALLTDLDGVVYIAGYLTMFNGVGDQ